MREDNSKMNRQCVNRFVKCNLTWTKIYLPFNTFTFDYQPVMYACTHSTVLTFEMFLLLYLFSPTPLIHFDFSSFPRMFLNIPQRTCLDSLHLLSSGESDSDCDTHRNSNFVFSICEEAALVLLRYNSTSLKRIISGKSIDYQISSLDISFFLSDDLLYFISTAET